jgi:hypothetical protein
MKSCSRCGRRLWFIKPATDRNVFRPPPRCSKCVARLYPRLTKKGNAMAGRRWRLTLAGRRKRFREALRDRHLPTG